MREAKIILIVLSILGIIYSPILFAAYPTYTECPNLSDADFKATKLVSNKTSDPEYFAMDFPIHMDFNMRIDGKVDVFFIYLTGKVFRYDAGTGKASEIGDLETLTDIGFYRIRDPLNAATSGVKEHEDGLSGIALDPNFKQNGYLYMYYTKYNVTVSGVVRPAVFRLARWTYNAQSNKIIENSGVTLLDIPAKVGQVGHTGGDMDFDTEGNLYIGIGDNMAAEQGPSCLGDLRGKILRIKPLPNPDPTSTGAGKTYTIPAGNFGQKLASVHPQYSNPDSVKPEIYVAGVRNPYTVTVDPLTKWVTWGDCGPDDDASLYKEEQNVATQPEFHGYPYFAGNNVSRAGNWGAQLAAAPRNTDVNCKGVRQLPPAIPGTYVYPKSCAMTGPIYRYNKDLTNNNRLPPHFNGKWFLTDWNQGFKRLANLDTKGKMIGAAETIFSGVTLFAPLEWDIGPDGVMYALNYATGIDVDPTSTNASIVKIEYVGTQTWSPTCLGIVPTQNKMAYKTLPPLFNLNKQGVNWVLKTDGSLYIQNLKGQIIFSQSITKIGSIRWENLPVNLDGVYFVEIKDGTQNQLQKAYIH